MALFLTSMIFWSKSPPGLTPLDRSPSVSLMATAALSHPDLATYYASASHSERNVAGVKTFESTNADHSLSTPPSTFYTNGLIP
jgi:hypothetical protein